MLTFTDLELELLCLWGECGQERVKINEATSLKALQLALCNAASQLNGYYSLRIEILPGSIVVVKSQTEL